MHSSARNMAMARLEGLDRSSSSDAPLPPPHGRPYDAHTRSKSAVLKSILHRRNSSEHHIPLDDTGACVEPLHIPRNTASMICTPTTGGALEELQQNRRGPLPPPTRSPQKERRDQAYGNNNMNSNKNINYPNTQHQQQQQHYSHQQNSDRSPTKTKYPYDGNDDTTTTTTTTATISRDMAKENMSRSPTKSTFGGLTFKSSGNKQQSPTKPKKSKSSTNLAALLSRPKSLRNLAKLTTSETDVGGVEKNKENTSPTSEPPPIYAQFCREATLKLESEPITGSTRSKQRQEKTSAEINRDRDGAAQRGSANSSLSNGQKVMAAIATLGHSGKTKAGIAAAPSLSLQNPQEIDKQLEAMLNRRNIPENQRYKMRNLNHTIKIEFIRQDWAEEQAKTQQSENAPGSDSSREGSKIIMAAEAADEKPKRSRGKSFTLGWGNSNNNNNNKEPPSPTKKSRGETGLGWHFRNKSTESIVGADRPTSAGSASSNGMFSSSSSSKKIPADFVGYLRKVQKPEEVEVGKLHKLRLLLRNETVAWAEDFIKQGGMREIVGLLYRIMAVEWREEHEDALLHENLLCLKALCTTALALQYLHSIQADLLPKLLHMLFDPDKKGPSEFTTRNIITSIVFTYIKSATTPQDRESRARTVLVHLRDPLPKEEERPLAFVLDMRRDRPYRVWCKEAVNVTKEVFWIFLHNLNVVELPSTAANTADGSYMDRHFPKERPPVPAAPYVGGVEWDATNYLASHLDLLNGIIACNPSRQGRNALREQLRISGWERCLGGSLRLCKEKFYGSVHDGLRTWVAAAVEDGWAVSDVRYGPPPEMRSSPVRKKPQEKKKEEVLPAAPRIEIPKLDFALDAPTKQQPQQSDAWLS